MELIGETLFAGAATAPLLALTAPISFWGGVDPLSGVIVGARHPQNGAAVGGRALYIASLIGSSSSSSILLELILNKTAPAALIVGAADAILVMGCLAGQTLGATPPPVVLAPHWPALANDTVLHIDAPQAGAAARITSSAMAHAAP